MALNFPANPELNETYPAGGVVYVWDGVKWTSKGSESGIPLLPDEQGNVVITGNLTVQGATITANAISGTSATLSGNLSAVDGNLSGNLLAVDGNLSGDLEVTGDINDA